MKNLLIILAVVVVIYLLFKPRQMQNGGSLNTGNTGPGKFDDLTNQPANPIYENTNLQAQPQTPVIVIQAGPSEGDKPFNPSSSLQTGNVMYNG